EIFFGAKISCFTCHTVGSEGGRVGPDLSKIAAIRSGHDLLESVAFPSASFARGYEPFTVITRDGQVHNGTVARETKDAVYLRTPVDERIARSSIVSMQPGRVSV